MTFDPNTRGTAVAQPNRVLYYGTAVEFAVGSELVKGNSLLASNINIYNGPPEGDSYSVMGVGFSSGTVAGVRIDRFSWVVSATASLFADSSLPRIPFSLADSRVGNSRVCIGDCFDGRILEGQITRLKRAR